MWCMIWLGNYLFINGFLILHQYFLENPSIIQKYLRTTFICLGQQQWSFENPLKILWPQNTNAWLPPLLEKIWKPLEFGAFFYSTSAKAELIIIPIDSQDAKRIVPFNNRNEKSSPSFPAISFFLTTEQRRSGVSQLRLKWCLNRDSIRHKKIFKEIKVKEPSDSRQKKMKDHFFRLLFCRFINFPEVFVENQFFLHP